MSYFFKNTKRFSIIFTALILTITLTAGSFAAVANGLPQEPQQDQAEETDIINGGMSFDDIWGEETEREELPVVEMSFNVPSEMNGVYLVPGADFLKTSSDSAETVKKQIDDSIEAAQKSKMNAVIIDTVYGDKVIYNTGDSDPKFPDFDLTGYITEKCREDGLFVYAIFDASTYESIETLDSNLSEFAAKYKLDGILLDGYEGKSDSSDYAKYIQSGGSMGYDNFLNEKSASIAKTASKAIRKAAPDTQAGLLANPVWANIADNKEGSDTKAAYTSLGSGFADTKSYIELGWFDFVAVKADTRTNDADIPFGKVAAWWSELAEKKSIPLYIVYPTSKVGANGWTSAGIDEQIAFAVNESAYRGAIFDSLKNAPGYTTAAPSVISVTPTKSESTDAANLVQPLSTTPAAEAPATATVSNQDKQADDDYEEIWEDEEDYGDEEDYSDVTSSEGDVIKSISPMGAVTGEYGEDITITAIALKDSDVIATLNGETVYLSLDTGYKTSDSNYARFIGVYTVSDDEDEDDDYGGKQFLGALSVYANSGGRDEIVDGAYFATTKTENSRYPVQVTADQASTYPTSTRDMVPIPTMYPLPKGSVDYAIGKPVTAKDVNGVKYTHLILESGVRIDAADVKEVKNGPKGNSVNSLSVSEKSGYTYITIKTDQKVTYSVSYTGKEFIVTFNNTTSVPSGGSLKSNKMFSKATWSGKNKLVLTLEKSGGFMGYKGYYDGDNLVFRFNNPPSSIKNAKILVDPGHGGTDTGNIGRNPTTYEKDINLAIAKKLVTELKARGATVKLLDTSSTIRMPERVLEAEKWGADMLISIHSNSATNTSAKGTEVFYFYPFSKQLATATSLNASKQFASTNRGAKQSYYRVTLSSQMASVMVETGFMTNSSDYQKLRKSSYQQKLAVGIANGIEGALKTAYTGKASNGTEFTSPDSVPLTGGDEDDTVSTSSGKVSSVSFSEETAQIKIGETVTLKPIYSPSSLKNVSFTWRTSSSSTISVDDNGKITGLKAGTATITATADDGSKQKASIRVTVTNEVVAAQAATIDVSGIALTSASDAYLDEEYIMVYPGNKQRVEIISDDGKVIRGADFKWSSDNTKIANVDANGIVTAKTVGDAVITATGGGFTFECVIEVSKTKVTVSGISLEETSITMVKKTSLALKATVLPKSASDKGITWTSSNSKIAEVNSSGVVTARNAGSVTITAKTKTGGYTAKCTIEVLNSAIVLEEIYTDGDFEMRVGATDTVYIEYYPENATVDKSLTFTSSNPNIVSVDSEGNVKAHAKGTVTITVTSNADRTIKDSCKVTVVQ